MQKDIKLQFGDDVFPCDKEVILLTITFKGTCEERQKTSRMVSKLVIKV